MSVVMIYNKAAYFGLTRDAGLLQTISQKVCADLGVRVGSIKAMDPMEPPVACDIAIHLEMPIMTFVPWARYNILMVNPEWFVKEAWTPYLSQFDLIVAKCNAAAKVIADLDPSIADKIFVLPWCAGLTVTDLAKNPSSNEHKDGFVSFLGQSASKHTALEQVIPFWRADYPALVVYSAEEEKAEWLRRATLQDGAKVTIKVGDLAERDWMRALAWAPGNLAVSSAEGFGYAAAEAEVAGAFTILNKIDVYSQDYADKEGVAWVACEGLATPVGKFTQERVVFRNGAQETLDAAVASFMSADMKAVRAVRQMAASERQAAFRVGLRKLWQRVGEEVNAKLAASGVKNLNRHLPPVLDAADCPPISVVTLFRNRRKFFHLAAHNILLTDYPKDKIEWVIVDDSDDPQDSPSDLIVSFQNTNTAINIKYVPLVPLASGARSIGAKRNIGVDKASADIIVFMDDDDHYPITSIRRRVAWLTKSEYECSVVGCTSIALYDLLKGVSAVNCPPMDIPLGQRVSEATLAFRKSFWTERKFGDVSMAEGESWISGREDAFQEVPPQQIIVAFTHGKNTSSRRLPDAKAGGGCFWGFPREFLQFVHGLAGITIEWGDLPKAGGGGGPGKKEAPKA
jgi:hypothetical protein